MGVKKSAFFLLGAIIILCTSGVEAGNVDFTPSDDVMPIGYEGITSFTAASPTDSGTATIMGAPSYTTQSWNMPTPMPMGQPMESKINIVTTNEDGVLGADIYIDSTLDGPIGGKGNVQLKPTLDTHDFSVDLEADSKSDLTFRTVDPDKIKESFSEDNIREGMPRNLDEVKSFKQPERAEQHVPIYTHDLDTGVTVSPRKFDTHTSGNLGFKRKEEDVASQVPGRAGAGRYVPGGYSFDDRDLWKDTPGFGDEFSSPLTGGAGISSAGETDALGIGEGGGSSGTMRRGKDKFLKSKPDSSDESGGAEDVGVDAYFADYMGIRA